MVELITYCVCMVKGNQTKVLALEEINFRRKLISCAKILAIMKICAKFLNCKKLQIISDESTQNSFVKQEPSRFLTLLFAKNAF
jgi:hypothetical protein